MIHVTRIQGRRTEHKFKRPPGMRQIISVSLLLAVVLFCMPSVLTGMPLSVTGEPQATLPAMPESTQTSRWDRGRAVRLAHSDDTVEELTMEEYLWGVVAAEMPASFELEALKAQAVAARTYTVSLQNSNRGKHPDADLCDDSACCQAYISHAKAQENWGQNSTAYSEKIAQAVLATDGLGVLYDGAPIQAVFFSSAPGQTADAVAVWGNSVSYLVGVDSPEGDEVPNYHSQVILTAQQAKDLILAAYPGADLSADPALWLGEVTADSAGWVTTLSFGGLTLTGSKARSLFSLRSSNFTAAWDGAQFVFNVTGYGHGVGLSQYGSNSMAKTGSDFKEILTWYYTGTQVDYLWT